MEIGRTLREAESPAACGQQAYSTGPPEKEHRIGSLKDFSAVKGVSEGKGLHSVLCLGERSGGQYLHSPPSAQ